MHTPAQHASSPGRSPQLAVRQQHRGEQLFQRIHRAADHSAGTCIAMQPGGSAACQQRGMSAARLRVVCRGSADSMHWGKQ